MNPFYVIMSYFDEFLDQPFFNRIEKIIKRADLYFMKRLGIDTITICLIVTTFLLTVLWLFLLNR